MYKVFFNEFGKTGTKVPPQIYCDDNICVLICRKSQKSKDDAGYVTPSGKDMLKRLEMLQRFNKDKTFIPLLLSPCQSFSRDRK